MPRKTKPPATPPAIDSAIHTIRGERVILDADLAKIYGVATKVFNQAVKRHRPEGTGRKGSCVNFRQIESAPRVTALHAAKITFA